MKQFKEDILHKIEETLSLCIENDGSKEQMVEYLMQTCADAYRHALGLDKHFDAPVEAKDYEAWG